MCRVLVVDDNRELADDLVEIIEADGHQACAAYSGQGALLRARECPYDTALVDMRMPDMDGVALVGRLMHDHPDQHYFFMTAHTDDKTIRRAMAISEGAVLEKPLDLARVLRLVAAGCH